MLVFYYYYLKSLELEHVIEEHLSWFEPFTSPIIYIQDGQKLCIFFDNFYKVV